MKPTGYTNVYPVFCYIENDATFKMRFCPKYNNCLLYTSDAADDSLRVDLGGRRIIKKIF